MPINKTKVTKIVDLDLGSLRGEARSEAQDEAGRIIVEEIQRFLDSSRSPVEGGSFKRKKADGSVSILLETGDMRSDIDVKPHSRGLQVGIFDSGEAPKAFNHNTGDTLPKRQFIPKPGESFRESIMKKVNKVVQDIKEDESGTTNVSDVLGAIEALELEQ